MSVASHAGMTVVRQSATPRNGRSQRLDLELIAAVDGALEVLHGKWKVHLLFVMARGVHRHSKLLECLPGVSKKVMTESLRALERDGLVAREIFAEVPVRVEYSLTPLGWTIYGSINGWHADRGDYAGVLELLLDAGATAPPLTPEVKATEAVLAVLRRRTKA